VKGFFRSVRGFFDGSLYAGSPAPKRIFRSQVTYISASAGLLLVCGFLTMVSYSFFFVLVFIVLELLVTAWHVTGTRSALEEVNAGLDKSRQAQVKSENIKTALITNVSHDLKTPLTSIISYVDLLSREEGLSDTARDYVNVLAGKADRLNHMVSDLFDLSKSISGNIPLEMDVLDLRTLLEQTLADMKDRIEASGLTVKANLGEKPVPVFSDGKKLYRVFQNLIDNGLKYGLAGSRLFIDLTAGERMAEVAVKNTAAYEMDFTPEEILQRFTRGDKARSGEGSGLGLSIAESFTQSCGGRFAVDIDGDQFKAAITLPIHDEGGR
jgi:signal transduction histidine kinase